MNLRHFLTVVIWLIAVVPVLWFVGEQPARGSLVPPWLRVSALALNVLTALVGATYLANLIKDRNDITESKE